MLEVLNGDFALKTKATKTKDLVSAYLLQA